MKAIIFMGIFVVLAILVVLAVRVPKVDKQPYDETSLSKATFAGGCFWCMEAPFEKLEGVKDVISGFGGGTEENPTYEEVSSGSTGHVEAVQVLYDPDKVSYEALLEVYWRQINPTDEGGQFNDRGFQYTTAIFYHTEAQRTAALASKEALEKSGMYDNPIVTPIKEFTTFYRAEDYHQDYYKTHSVKYKTYRYLSGRDKYLQSIWTAPPVEKDELKERLTPLQFAVTQKGKTEKAFDNEYWDNKEEGIYVDVVSGKPLFSSKDKYDSGSGWPSFTKPIDREMVTLHEDRTLFSERTEVKSAGSSSHLGHVFDDGPQPTGERYCINSAALRFIPKDKLEEEGYGEYVDLFEE